MSEYMKPAAAIILPLLGGYAGSFITRRNMSPWFENLKRPSWHPPHKILAPVWSLLYGTMGYASYMVWRDGGGFEGDAALPLAWYGAQLALNWAWPPIFFGFHSMKWAFVEIVALWGAVAGTIYNFHGINETAAHMLIPYLGWVIFAGVLNFRVWQDNRDKRD